MDRTLTDDKAIISVLLQPSTPAVGLVNVDRYIRSGGGEVIKPWKYYRGYLVAKYKARARIIHTVRRFQGVRQAKVKFY